MREVLKSAPVLFQERGFAQLVQNATNIPDHSVTSPYAIKNITVTRLSSNVKYPVKCLIFGLQVGVCIYSVGLTSVTSGALMIRMVKQILEEML
jgi:hypothetical protein